MRGLKHSMKSSSCDTLVTEEEYAVYCFQTALICGGLPRAVIDGWLFLSVKNFHQYLIVIQFGLWHKA